MKTILSVYTRSDHLFYNSNNSSIQDSVCKAGFNDVISELYKLPRSGFADSLLYQANFKLGILYDVHKDYSKATNFYLQAMKYTSDSGKRFSELSRFGARSFPERDSHRGGHLRILDW